MTRTSAALVVLLLAALTLAGACGGGESKGGDRSADKDRGASGSGAANARASVDLEARGRAAADVVRQFYGDVNAHRFERAWPRLGYAVRRNFGTFEAWKAGYATTRSTEARVTRAAAAGPDRARVEVRLASVDADGCGRRVSQRFAGTWNLRRHAGRWRAVEVTMAKTGGGTLKAECTTGSDGEARNADSGAADGERSPQGQRNGSEQSAATERVCYPETTLPKVELPEVRLPEVRLPATTVGERRIPARTIPGRTIGARTIPARTIPGRCFDAPASFAPERTTVRVSGYDEIDSDYSAPLSRELWDDAPSISVPDYTAPGFGESNAAGFPKNQYVKSYVTRSGKVVSGYWRNSPSDGLPTCKVISC